MLATATVFDEIAQAKVARSDLLIICVRSDRAYLEVLNHHHHHYIRNPIESNQRRVLS